MRCRVLLVDSSGSRSRVLEELLSKRGFIVTRCDPYASTCPLCSHEAPALVIVSLTVGIGTGMALTRCMSATGAAPVLVLGSGHYEGEDVAAEAVGAAEFVQAPYSLVEVVRRCCELVDLLPQPVAVERGSRTLLSR